MNKLKEIAIAWYNAANPTPEMKEIADSRLQICEGCEEVKTADIGGFHYCGACGCPLNKKIFSPRGPSACPKRKWVK
jgi:hypothetical protein